MLAPSHYVFSFVCTVLSFGAHRVMVAWASKAFPSIARHRWPLLAACVAVAICPALSRVLMMKTRSAVADAIFALSGLELMIVLSVAAPLVLLLVAGKMRRDRQDAAPSPPPEQAPRAGTADPVVGRRLAVERIGGTAVVGATSAAFGWGLTLGRHDYQIREIPVRIPGLPKELDGYVIAQISDIHVGLFVGERELRDAKDLITRVRPDIVVATGDLVDFDPGHAPQLARALADLTARDGVFAILGNHDYYAGHVAIADAVRAAGVTLLVNDARVIRGDKGGFALVGVDDAWSQPYGGPGPNLKAATASLPAEMPRVLLAHQPNGFRTFAGQVALQLSGHTHGGQITPGNLLLRGPVAGVYQRNGSTLYVNSGFGVAGPPARLGVPPEITKVVLVAA